MTRVLELFECVTKVQAKLPAESLIPVKLSFYQALAKRESQQPIAEYFHHLIQGAHDWCALPTGRLTLADYQQLARTMHDHFRLLARVLVEQQAVPESFVAFEMGRARAYAAELSHDSHHSLLAANPFRDGKVGLDLLFALQRRLPSDAVLNPRAKRLPVR